MKCLIYDRNCINCGECDELGIEDNDYCDLDPNKICDNCCKCIEGDNEYRAIKITEIKKEDK